MRMKMRPWQALDMAQPDPDALPALGADDVAYVRRDFLTLAAACAWRGETADQVRRLISERRLPRPTYLLPDRTEMVPPDYFELHDAAGGVGPLPAWFARRLGEELTARAMDASAAHIEEEWTAYLAGEYGACLRRVSPAAIAEKARLIASIEDLVAGARRGDVAWRAALRRDVDLLDGMVREFARWDRLRFGGPLSRDRLITAVRERHADLWSGGPASATGAPTSPAPGRAPAETDARRS